MQKVNQAVFAAVERVAHEKSISLDRIQEHHTLVEDLGFRSLDLARIVAMIELALDADPFASLVPVTSIRTVGDLCAAYAKCFAAEGDGAAPAGPADAAQTDAAQAGRRASSREHQRDLRRRARGGEDGK